MPTLTAEGTAPILRPRKVAIIGNSNSVMHDGYVRTLERTPGLTIVNRSIGSSPNVVLLDFLGRETEIDYDFVIVETAVVDCLQAGPLYPRERSQETLELFISLIRATSKAQVIILTIPTRYALLAPDDHWQEQLYLNTAARLGVPILDGFRLIRGLLGHAKVSVAEKQLRRAEQLATAFGLPGNIAPSLAWRDLRDRFVPTNALGVAAFVDHAHFSGAIHSLVGEILADFITSVKLDHSADRELIEPSFPPPVVAINTNTGTSVVRTSSLMFRTLTALRVGDTVCYECPAGYRAYGLLVNQSKTFCFLQLNSPAGTVAFDMRFRAMPFDWIGVVVPIIDHIGKGVIEVTATDIQPDAVPCRLLHNTDIRAAEWFAELGEMILVRENWRDQISLPQIDRSPLHLEDTASAKSAIDDAARHALPVIQGIEADGRFVPSDCSAVVTNLLTKGSVVLSLADQARLLLVLGMTDRLPVFFKTALMQQGDDKELQRMSDAFQLAEIAASSISLDSRGNVAVVPKEQPVASSLATREDTRATVSASGIGGPVMDGPLAAWIQAAEKAPPVDQITLLEEALGRFPDETRLLHDLARAHEKQRDWSSAETYWRRFLARDRRHWWVYSALGAALRAQDRTADSDIVLREAVLLFPNEPQLLAEIARTAQIRGDLPEAMLTWDLIIAQFPSHWIGYRGKVQTLAQAGMYAEADKLIATFAPKCPNNTDALHDLARLAERRREWKQAEVVWRSFLALDQRAVWAYLALAQGLLEQARYQEAADVLRDAQTRFPNDADLSAEAARCAELLEEAETPQG